MAPTAAMLILNNNCCRRATRSVSESSSPSSQRGRIGEVATRLLATGLGSVLLTRLFNHSAEMETGEPATAAGGGKRRGGSGGDEIEERFREAFEMSYW